MKQCYYSVVPAHHLTVTLPRVLAAACHMCRQWRGYNHIVCIQIKSTTRWFLFNLAACDIWKYWSITENWERTDGGTWWKHGDLLLTQLGENHPLKLYVNLLWQAYNVITTWKGWYSLPMRIVWCNSFIRHAYCSTESFLYK